MATSLPAVQFLLNVQARRKINWVEPGENSRICTQCYARFRRQDPIPSENENNVELDVDDDEGNSENIRNVSVKLPTNQRVCCVCGVFIIRKRISREAVLKIWIQNRIFFNLENRSCPEHFENGYFSEEAVALMRLRGASRQFTHGDNECLINLLTDCVVALEETCKIFDFDNENMNEDDCKAQTD
ncbi:hypothetical protein JTB14_024476 [Gonioctena quinquepunctata]|nr:hypothetical protein JTB14_024476 [Gonioctena quinquepunctata]